MRAHPMRHRRAAAMMNVVAIGLVLSTLAAAGVWSPSPAPPTPAAQQHGDHVVREGRRVVIVEYEREVSGEDGGRVKVKETRVLPPDALDGVEDGGGAGGVVDGARGVVSEAAGKAAGVAEEGKERLYDANGGVLGAVKRCKDRLCGAGRRAEEGAKDAASRAEHAAEDAARGAVETVSDAKDSAENKALDAARHGKERLKSAKDRASDAARQGKETLKDKASDEAHQGKETVKSAKDKVAEAASKAKEKASDVQHGAAEAAKGAKDRVSEAAKHAKETVRGAKDRVSDMAERAEEYAEDAAERAADRVAEAEAAVEAKAGEMRRNLTDIARRARGVASDAAAYLFLAGGGPREAARVATAVMHLLGLATAYGTCVWVTFVSSYVLAAALPRQQLGMLQSKLYPVYFRAMAYGVGLALAAHLLGRERRSAAARAQSFNLAAALALVLANMLLLEPKATKVMFERMKVEKEEGRGRDVADIVDPPAATVATTDTNAARAARPEAAAAHTTPVDGAATAKAKAGNPEMSKSRVVRLSKRLKQLNGYSSLCNVLSLMSLTWHLVHLARRINTGTAC
ncbi:seed biotin-containing protein SBP65 [Setaria italica]|nr:seed biotin-containing protein SBP65 [Setaria italica]